MSNFKKAVDKEGENLLTSNAEKRQSTAAKDGITGVAGDKLIEPVPVFEVLTNERVIQGENNTFIVLGRDRPGGRLSGYGGSGDTQAGSIDIVVGRGAGASVRAVDKNNDAIFVDPDFENDAARIHMSWKTDVDDNFNLPRGSNKATAKSAIGIKADNVRVVSRESIKLVAGVDKVNSQGGSSRAIYGIDLIGKADETTPDLQSIPKGENLIEALADMRDDIDALNGIVESLFRILSAWIPIVSAHTHPTAPPSPELVAGSVPAIIQLGGQSYSSIISHKLNAARYKLVYLNPAGARYVNSRVNKVN